MPPDQHAAGREKVVAIGPVVQLLNEEEERAGITLTLEQRTAILKILREVVDRDARAIRELWRSTQESRKPEMNGDGLLYCWLSWLDAVILSSD